jgi:hypothetical protein
MDCLVTNNMATRETARAEGSLIRSLSPEMIVLILQNCDSTRDLLALISTCRHIYDVWRVNPAASIWPVYLHELPHFQDAITAVSTRGITL